MSHLSDCLSLDIVYIVQQYSVYTIMFLVTNVYFTPKIRIISLALEVKIQLNAEVLGANKLWKDHLIPFTMKNTFTSDCMA